MKALTKDFKTVVVAGGCYWGVEEYYRRLEGIIDTQVGFAQGHTENPNYEEVCAADTNHAEVVFLSYNPAAISLEAILDHLFRIIDPTSLNKQGNDVGTQYRCGVYYTTDDEKQTITDFIKQKQADYKRPIVVEVEHLNTFWSADEYHQKYLVKNPSGYCHVDFSVINNDELKESYRRT